MIQVVNVVASGALDVEFDLEAVARELDDVVDYNLEKYPGAYVRFDDDAPLITLYRTGKYIITGAVSEAEAGRLRDEFLVVLHRHGIVSAADDPGSLSRTTYVWQIWGDRSICQPLQPA